MCIVYKHFLKRLFSDSSGDDEANRESSLPPGVSQEDIDLFKQAQDNAQDLLNKVGTPVPCLS